MSTREQWWDEATEAPNLSRQLVGQTLSFGDPEIGQAERICSIESIAGFAVGIDAAGLFSAIEVQTKDGDFLRLYADGKVTDIQDTELGTHAIKDEKE